MTKKWLIKLGTPILALSLVTACGTGDEEDPVEDDIIEDPVEEDDAPLNQEEGDMGGTDEDLNGNDGLGEDGTDDGMGDDNGTGTDNGEGEGLGEDNGLDENGTNGGNEGTNDGMNTDEDEE